MFSTSMTKNLPMPLDHVETMRPDTYGHKDDLPFIVAEIKRPDFENLKFNELDQLKLFCEMKLALDQLLQAGVDGPQVLGFLVQCKILAKTGFQPIVSEDAN